MSVIPVLRQVRRQVVLANGSVAFEVANQITDPGDLPFPHLFVVTITDPANPKSDVLARISTPTDIRQADSAAPLYVKVLSTDLIRISADSFARIANINDVSRLPRDRVVAVRQGATDYLTTTVALLYDNVTTADAAAKQIRDRLSALVSEWRTFNTDFATNPYQDYNLPQSASSVEAERTALYVTARQARIAAETERDAAQQAKEKCERDCEADKVIYDFLVYDVAFLQQARADVTAQINDTYLSGSYSISPAILTPGGPFVVSIATSRTRDYVLKQGAFTSNENSYANLLTKKQSDLAVYAQRVSACEVNCAQLAAALLAAQQTVDAATSAERAALARVIAVCPTFNPSTV